MDANINVPFSIALAFFGTVLIILGISGDVNLGGYSVSFSQAWQKILLFIIGGTLLTVSIWLGYLKELSERRRSSKHRSRRSSEGPMVDAKLFFTTVSERSEPFHKMVENATDLDILVISAVNLLGQHQEVLENLGKSGCKIRMLFLDPGCSAARYVYGGKYERYLQNINSSLAVMKNMKEELQDKFQVRALQFAPTVSVIAVTKRKGAMQQRFMQVQLYLLRSVIGADRPVFRIRFKDKWYKVFKREFEMLWGSSPEWKFITQRPNSSPPGVHHG